MAFTQSLLQTHEGVLLHIGRNLASVQNYMYFFALDYFSVSSIYVAHKISCGGGGEIRLMVYYFCH